MKYVKYVIPFIVGLALLLVSCEMFYSDEELNSYEDNFVAEQAAASVSSNEGGVIYMTESLADPTYYEDLQDEAEFDSETGTFSVIRSINFPNVNGSALVSIIYSL